LHPGFVRTEIFDKSTANFGFIKKVALKTSIYLFSPFIYMISRNCWEGAQTTIHAACDDEIPNESGKYF
jgi:hypothetical protein